MACQNIHLQTLCNYIFGLTFWACSHTDSMVNSLIKSAYKDTDFT